jgi:hypothetical protein
VAEIVRDDGSRAFSVQAVLSYCAAEPSSQLSHTGLGSSPGVGENRDAGFETGSASWSVR